MTFTVIEFQRTLKPFGYEKTALCHVRSDFLLSYCGCKRPEELNPVNGDNRIHERNSTCICGKQYFVHLFQQKRLLKDARYI